MEVGHLEGIRMENGQLKIPVGSSIIVYKGGNVDMQTQLI